MTNITLHINTNAPLELNSITIKEDYAKKWNERMSDFLLLCREGKPLRETIYRLGGLGSKNDLKNNYFLLLKYVEHVYDYDFIKKCYPNKSRKELELQRNHLEGRWCILDKYGNEKKEFESFSHPYLSGGVIYSLNNNYYNIETGELYANAYSSMSSDEYLFLDNAYDKDKDRRGIMKIHKQSGKYEIFSKK